MKNTIFFAVCRYVPSLLRGETLNIGFVYHVPTLEKLGFYESRNTRRLRSFDDELDIDTINMIFESLRYDFNDSPDIYENGDLEMNLSNHLVLKHKLYNYVNQVQFGEISVMEFEDTLNSVLTDIADMYLYYDKPKNSRINHERVKSLAKKIIKASDLNSTLTLVSNEDPFYNKPYDFKIWIDDKPIYVKGFSFDYLQQSRFYKEIKSYLYDLQHAIKSEGLNVSEVKIVINNTTLEKEHEKVIQNILPENLEYLTLEKFSSFVAKNKQKEIYN